MKIASANIGMQASYTASQHVEASERLEVRVGEAGRGARPTVAAPASPIAISPEAAAACETERACADTDALDSDPRLGVLKRLIELLTGRPLRLLRTNDLARRDEPPALPARAAAEAANRPARAGFGIDYEYHARYSEYERTRFSADGTVFTADGREIRFELALEMERSYAESLDVHLRAGDARVKDPLVLDFAGPAAALSDARFSFDLDADGTLDDVPLLAGGRGYLAIDRNGNDRIDDGRELFGPASGDGFAELARLDADANGWIDEADAGFAQLRVWQPAGDGGTLSTLRQANVGALYLGRVATPFELRGAANDMLGAVRASGVYLREDGSVGSVSQIDLAV